MDGNTPSSPTPFTPPTTEEDRLSWLRLIRSRRVGPGSFARLMAEYGSAPAVLDALPAIARTAGIDDYTPFPLDQARREWAAGQRAGARLICLGEPAYPAALTAINDAPPVLWLRGRDDLLARPMVAVVGARNASSLGGRMARKLAEGLGWHRHVVVSGLARGIDTAAHGAALKSGTLAVMAGGVDVIYPAENAALAAAIADQGLLLSEQPFGMPPQARHFPARNRIIAGLSKAVVVIEAAEGSGSLITARNALDQGREVLAVPGHPLDARAAGCNQLIRDGARLIRDVADIIEVIGAAPPPPARDEPSRDGVRGKQARAGLMRRLLTPAAGTAGSDSPSADGPLQQGRRRDQGMGHQPLAGTAAPDAAISSGRGKSAQTPQTPRGTDRRTGRAASTSAAPPVATTGSVSARRDALPQRGRNAPTAQGAPMAPREQLADAPADATADRQGVGNRSDPRPARRAESHPRPDTLTLHRLILNALGPSPVPEDQLIRDLALPAASIAPALLFLELDGRVQRQPGGMLVRR